jgi:hypothetical protein
MSVAESIARTIARLNDVTAFSPGPWMQKVYEGLSKEFERFNTFKNLVLCATVPSSGLCTEALDDLESKYGISYLGDVADQERIDRIIERASLYGAGGKDWLEQQIQAAGFPLYVIENTPTVAFETQYGDDTQHQISTQYAIMPDKIDPGSVAGILITSSANRRGARRVVPESQYGTGQYGEPEYSTPDFTYAYPQPGQRQIPTDATLWGRVFFLSPFSDRVAAPSEMLLMGNEKIRYLIKLVTQIKYLSRWCIAQVALDVERITDEGDTRVLEDGDTIRSV